MGRPKVFPHYLTIHQIRNYFIKSSPLNSGHYVHNSEPPLALDLSNLFNQSSFVCGIKSNQNPRNSKESFEGKATLFAIIKSAELSI